MKRNDLLAFLWICSYMGFIFGGIFTYIKFTTTQDNMITVLEKKDVAYPFAIQQEPTITVILQEGVCERKTICLKGL